MNDRLLDSLARDRIATMVREADAYRALIDTAPLHFREARFTRARRALASTLRNLSRRLDPRGEAIW